MIILNSSRDIEALDKNIKEHGLRCLDLDLNKELRKLKNVSKLMRKPDRKEYSLYLKMTLLGMLLVGAIGFIIQLLGAVFGLMRG